MLQLPNGSIYPGAPEESQGPDSLPDAPKHRERTLSGPQWRKQLFEKAAAASGAAGAGGGGVGAAGASKHGTNVVLNGGSSKRLVKLFLAGIGIVAAVVVGALVWQGLSGSSSDDSSSVNSDADRAASGTFTADAGTGGSTSGNTTGSGPAEVPAQLSQPVRDAQPACNNGDIFVYSQDFNRYPGVQCGFATMPSGLLAASVIQDPAASEEFFTNPAPVAEIDIDAPAVGAEKIKGLAIDNATVVGVQAQDKSLIYYQFQEKLDKPQLTDRLRELGIVE